MVRFCAILALLVAPLARADGLSDRLALEGAREFSAAYRTWDAAAFSVASGLFRQAGTNAPGNGTNFYWLGVSEFHRMLQLQGPGTNKAAADAALESAINALTIAVKLDGRSAESHALLGTLYGMKIDGHLFRAMRLGPRISQHKARALEFGAENPRVQYLLGMCQLHTASKPPTLKQALASLLVAEKLFDSSGKATAATPLEPRWGHDSCLAFIGRAHELLGQLEDARNYFRKALALHPGNHVAREGLKRVSKPD